MLRRTVVKKALAGESEHLVGFFKSAVSAVVGVGDVLGCFEGGIEGTHEVELGLWGAELDEVAFVGGVHGDDPLVA